MGIGTGIDHRHRGLADPWHPTPPTGRARARRSAVRTGVLMVVAALVLVLFPTPHAAGVDDANLDFESGELAPWSSTAGSWRAVQPGYQSDWAVEMVDDSPITSASLRSTRIPVAPGGHEFGMWVSVDQGTPSVYVYFYDSTGQRLDQASARLRGVSGDWTWQSITATAPAGTATAEVMLYSSTGDVTTARWDGVTVAPSDWSETSMGHPLRAVTLIGATIGTGADGRSETWAVSNGKPAMLQVIDTATGTLENHLPLDGAGGSWSVVQHSSGDVYIATWPGGLLFRYDPATGEVSNLGRAPGAGTYLWDLEESDDGLLWFGSSPEGALTSYDPRSGEFTDHGPMAPGQGYARSVTTVGDLVYVGMGSADPQIVEYDPATGTKRSIPVPAELSDREFVYSLDNRHGSLYTRVQGVTGSDLHRYDVEDDEWTAIAPVAQVALSPDSERDVYFQSEGQLQRYQPRSGRLEDLGVGSDSAIRAMGWVNLDLPGMPGKSLVTFDGRGGFLAWNPRTRQSTSWQAAAEPVPVQLHAIEPGPGGQLYVSGFIHHGLARCDPGTLECTQLPTGGVGQIEGMWANGNDLYLGSYGHARLFRYDTTAPWVPEQNPTLLADLSEQHFQDRPFGWTAAAGRIWTTTVPVYGHLGGVVASIDPDTDAVTVYDDVLGQRSGSSLATIEDDLIIGTSVWGGGGATPTEAAGSVIRWDPETRKALWETTFDDQLAITAVRTSADGQLWALSIDTLYRLDPTSGAILESIRMGTWEWADSAAWVHGHLEFGEDGRLYILTLRHLWSYDPDTGAIRDLASGVTSFDFALVDAAMFFYRGDEMFRLGR